MPREDRAKVRLEVRSRRTGRRRVDQALDGEHSKFVEILKAPAPSIRIGYAAYSGKTGRQKGIDPIGQCDRGRRGLRSWLAKTCVHLAPR